MLLVFGSLNVDMLFRVEALPRPGETVLSPHYELAPGGKGANQAAAAAKTGASVRMIGGVGDDAFGSLARSTLEQAGVDCTPLATFTRPTGTAVIGVDAAGENQIMVASGANLDARADQVEEAWLSAGTTLLCQNEVRAEETFALIARARARGARTILNLAPAAAVPADVLDRLDVLVVNEVEAGAAARTAAGASATALARDLARRHGLTCVLTLGAKGAIATTPDGGHRVDALPISPVDTTGAGDTFVGVLAAGLDHGLPLPAALKRASVAASLACTGIGAQTSQPSLAAIEARLMAVADAAPLA